MPESAHQWHLDRRVNVGHMLTTAIIAGGLFSAWAAQNERITKIEAEVRAQSTAAIKEAAAIRDALTEVKSEIRQVRQLLIDQIRQGRGSPGM